MTSKLHINSINYLVAVPLIVMSYHVYSFFETEPWIIRVALAVSFDILVVVCFYLLKDEHIKARKSSRQMTYAALAVLIGFQLYVNVWAYSELAWYRALVSGSIFPLTVGFISYIAMRREERIEDLENKRQSRQQRRATKPAPSAPESSPAPAEPEDGWSGKLVTKEDVSAAFPALDSLEDAKNHFSGCRNLKSVKRWYTKLEQGKEL